MSLTQINKAGLDEIALDHVFTIGASGTDHYTFQGEGLNGTVNDPTLYLTRGKTYRFENGTGAHAIRIQSADDGTSGTLYNTGVTNNNTTGTVIVEVQHDAPDVLYYQCASHANMKGTIYVTGALADGGVTTAKIADQAVTSNKIANGTIDNVDISPNAGITGGKLANDAITTAKIADSAVTTAKIAADAVTTAKLADNAVGTANIQDDAVATQKIADSAVTGGKIANSSITDAKVHPSAAIAKTKIETFVNTNADNRILTGTASTNTIQGESQLLFDSNGLLYIKAPDGGNRYFFGETGNSQSAQLSLYNSSDQQKVRIAAGDGASEAATYFNGGKVGIGTSSPTTNLHVHTDANGEGVLIKSTGNTSNALTFDANRGAGGGIGNVYGRWNGTTVAQISFISGADGTNKDDGVITFGTESAASNGNVNATERLRIDSSGVLQTANKTITGGNNNAIQNIKCLGTWSGVNSVGKSIELISGYDSTVKMAAISYNLTDTSTGGTYGGDLNLHSQPLYSSPTTPIPIGLKVKSDGCVQLPKNPSFRADLNNSVNNTQLASGARKLSHTLGHTLDQVRWDVGSNYTSSNSRFTCPVDGTYVFHLYLGGHSSSESQSYVGNEIYVNGTRYNGAWNNQDAGYQYSERTWTLKLEDGDYVEPGYELANNNGWRVIGSAGVTKRYTGFEGYLVG